MGNKEIEQIIRTYIPQVIHMSVASVGAEGKPWAWEVHYAFDGDLNLYWVSVLGARHSQEVLANPNVSGTIVTQHHLDQFARGVSFEGKAEVVETVDENHPALKAYASRFPSRTASILEGYAKDGPGVRRIFKVTVSDFYLADGLKTGIPEKHHLVWK